MFEGQGRTAKITVTV